MTEEFISFGKFKGERWTRLPISYLRWLINAGTQWSGMAKQELERRGTIIDVKLEISGHAIDRASLKLRKVWHETSNKGEGLYSWLNRMASEALKKSDLDEIFHMGMRFIFDRGELYPTLKTVMPEDVKKKIRTPKSARGAHALFMEEPPILGRSKEDVYTL